MRRGLVPDVPVEVDGELRTRLYRDWYNRGLDRINAPLAVSELPGPIAVEVKELPAESEAEGPRAEGAESDRTISDPPTPDPALARAVDLLSRLDTIEALLAPEWSEEDTGVEPGDDSGGVGNPKL